MISVRIGATELGTLDLRLPSPVHIYFICWSCSWEKSKRSFREEFSSRSASNSGRTPRSNPRLVPPIESAVGATHQLQFARLVPPTNCDWSQLNARNRLGPGAHFPARPSAKSLSAWHFPAEQCEVELQVRIAKCRSGFLRVSRQLSERA